MPTSRPLSDCIFTTLNWKGGCPIPQNADFILNKAEDGTLTINLAPQQAVGGWTVQFTLMKRFNGDPILTKSCASGFINVSGINVVNSGTGSFTVRFNPAEFSGNVEGNYAFLLQRTDSGFATILAEGYRLALP